MNFTQENNPNWRGGKIYNRTKGNEYYYINCPNHPRANNHGYVPEHILIVEKALGKYLRSTAPVHHVDNIGTNNSNSNLVACDSQGYHLHLHARLNALNACGNPNYRRCTICQVYDDVNSMYKYKNKEQYYHRNCYNIKNKGR